MYLNKKVGCELKFRWFILMCVVMLTPVTAFCDDALLKVYGGSVKMHNGDSTSIRMESEVVRIDLHEKTYTVDATFEFVNYGKTMTAQVGFPKSGYGYTPGFEGVMNFNSFETWVDGDKVDVKEMPGEMTINRKKVDAAQMAKIKTGDLSGPLEETHWLVKIVTFKGNAKTLTRVKYTGPYGGRHEDKGEYLYGTGKSWKGTIGKARFVVKASPTVTLLDVAFTENGYEQNIRQFEFKRLGEYEYEYTLKDIEPKESENLKFLVTSKWEAWEGPAYSEKVIGRAQLQLLSLWQLKILRNTIYAYHGMIFKDRALDKYFRKYDWYKPSSDFKESDLNKTEKDNVNAILNYEKELKEIIRKQ